MSFKATIKGLAAALLSPGPVASIALIAGCTLLVAGVHALAGDGWALIAGAVPLLLLAFVLIRGAQRVGA